MKQQFLLKTACIALITLLSAQLFAQAPPRGPQPPPDQNGSPDQAADTNDPSRGVARISLINGEVSVRRGDTGDVTAAAMNAPLLSQDRILTASSSRAEMQFDNANLARLGSNAELRMTDLERGKYILELATGTITYRVLRDSKATAEVDTPSVAVHPVGLGTYRIMVREDGASEITVRSGQAEIYSPKGSRTLQPGQTMLVRGSSSDPEFQIVQAIPVDDWDRWNEDRDHDLVQSRSYQYVSPDITGAEDLDKNGTWQYSAPYGNVWVPTVAPGWAPYQQGRWAWEDYYGWTWVSYDPWGWAPYHYGRWFHGSFGWGWYPGPIYSPYFWAPAYVGFFGWGGGFGFGFGFGNIGWCALAPFEAFHPWWGRGYYAGYRGGVYGNHTTVINNVNVTNIYRNARVANGVTGMSAQNFGRTATAGNMVRVSADQLRSATAVRGQLPATPSRESLNFNNHSVNASRFPQTTNRQFFNHATASQTPRVSFEQQQRSMEQTQRQVFHQSGANTNSASTVQNHSVNGAANQIQRTTQGQGQQGWSRADVSTRPNSAADTHANTSMTNNGAAQRSATSNPASTTNGGWRRFSDSPQQNSGTRSYQNGPSSGSTGWGHSQINEPSAARSYGGSQPVRINPSIVQNRQSSSAPSYRSSPSYRQPSYSSPGYSRPSYSSPGYSAPSRSYDAPTRSSGGGGGGHYSGGGGAHPSSGGGHAGGGGGGHHGR